MDISLSSFLKKLIGCKHRFYHLHWFYHLILLILSPLILWFYHRFYRLLSFTWEQSKDFPSTTHLKNQPPKLGQNPKSKLDKICTLQTCIFILLKGTSLTHLSRPHQFLTDSFHNQVGGSFIFKNALDTWQISRVQGIVNGRISAVLGAPRGSGESQTTPGSWLVPPTCTLPGCGPPSVIPFQHFLL